MKNIKIVVADDTVNILEYIGNIIKSSPNLSLVGKAHDGEEAIKIILETKPDLIITDLEMPKYSGLEVIEKIKHESNYTPHSIIVSGIKNQNIISSIINLDIDRFLIKPINKGLLISTIMDIFTEV